MEHRAGPMVAMAELQRVSEPAEEAVLAYANRTTSAWGKSGRQPLEVKHGCVHLRLCMCDCAEPWRNLRCRPAMQSAEDGLQFSFVPCTS